MCTDLLAENISLAVALSTNWNDRMSEPALSCSNLAGWPPKPVSVTLKPRVLLNALYASYLPQRHETWPETLGFTDKNKRDSMQVVSCFVNCFTYHCKHSVSLPADCLFFMRGCHLDMLCICMKICQQILPNAGKYAVSKKMSWLYDHWLPVEVACCSGRLDRASSCFLKKILLSSTPAELYNWWCNVEIQTMFSYAVNHPERKADIEARNDQRLCPLTLACKVGRFQLFNEITQLRSYVSSLFSSWPLFSLYTYMCLKKRPNFETV